MATKATQPTQPVTPVRARNKGALGAISAIGNGVADTVPDVVQGVRSLLQLTTAMCDVGRIVAGSAKQDSIIDEFNNSKILREEHGMNLEQLAYLAEISYMPEVAMLHRLATK